MKKILVAVVLAVAGTALSQQTAAPAPQAAAPQPQTAAPAPQAAAAPQKKEIKDPAEYNAYVSAVQQADEAAKISGLEAFLVQYPNSVMKPDALEILMGSYQKTGNAAKMTDAANRLLQNDPNNVRALALLAYSNRGAQKWPDARQYAERGLQAIPQMPKPDGVSDADFQKQKTELSALLNSVAGFSALQMKDNATAQKDLLASVTANPNNLEDVYPLGLAYLTANPPDTVNGLFFIARAANLAQGAGQTQITNYGKSVYTKYHGADQGWDDVLTAAKANPLPPANFTVAKYVPPTPAEQCADMLKTKAPKDMSFAEWELCLSKGKPEDSDKVWTAIKGVPLQMEAQVISADPNTVQLAGSSDDIDAKRADITLTMDGPIPAKLMPKEGGPLDFQGTPVSFTPDPFVVTMEKGALLTKAAPPTHKAPVHKRPASQ
jgi:tetratricopeptide (TPR) repeat protein